MERLSTLVVVVAAVASAAIAWSSTKHLDTLWDEQVDHDIAVALRDDPLTGGGPALDPTQTRLPMYVTAAAYALCGRDDLAVGRAVSVVVGALTVIGTALLGRVLFDRSVGLLAAVLLAFSPYFLSFERIAMTEGDVYFCCTATWAIWAILRDARAPSAGRWLAAAVLSGLAIGAKLFAVPLLVLVLVLAPRTQTICTFPAHGKLARILFATLAAGAVLAAITFLVSCVSQRAATPIWAAALVTWVLVVTLVFRSRWAPHRPVARAVSLMVLAFLTLCATMPAHLLQPEIGKALIRHALAWHSHSSPIGPADHLRLYAGIVLLKTSVPWGVLGAVGLLAGLSRAAAGAPYRICHAIFVLYVAFLCLLPLRQTFYLMGVYPLLVVATAAFVVDAAAWLRKRARRLAVAWTVLLVGLSVHLAVRVYRAHPCYHLYGYDLVGDRWLGAESRGYRNVIQTPSDGVETLLRWLSTDARVKDGARVVSFLWEERIIDAALARSPPRYTLVRRGLSQHGDVLPPQPSLEDADFVLLHINNRLGYGDRTPDWPPVEVLESRFEPVHTVRRGPLEVAWVYAVRQHSASEK